MPAVVVAAIAAISEKSGRQHHQTIFEIEVFPFYKGLGPFLPLDRIICAHRDLETPYYREPQVSGNL